MKYVCALLFLSLPLFADDEPIKGEILPTLCGPNELAVTNPERVIKEVCIAEVEATADVTIVQVRAVDKNGKALPNQNLVLVKQKDLPEKAGMNKKVEEWTLGSTLAVEKRDLCLTTSVYRHVNVAVMRGPEPGNTTVEIRVPFLVEGKDLLGVPFKIAKLEQKLRVRKAKVPIKPTPVGK